LTEEKNKKQNHPAPDSAGVSHAIRINEIFAKTAKILLEEKDFAGKLPQRNPDSHKGTYGHLLVLAGSKGKTGAAVLAGKAALRMGAGLVTIGTAEAAKALRKFQSKATGAVHLLLPDAGLVCAERLLAAGNKADALALYRALADSKQPPVRQAVQRAMLKMAQQK
jgi:NAD(P)H-hydrate repair Nnr-like enzyme with NAD(P)H-hydrate dehydratase domain